MNFERTPRRPRVPPKPRTVEHDNNNKEQDPVEVFCRIRPVDTLDTCVSVINSSTIQIVPPASSLVSRSGCAREQHYKFRQVFGDNCNQKQVFDKIAKPLVSDVLSGKNALLFAYGVTGSGKTHTMQGTSRDGGIVLRTLDVIFNSISEWQASRCVFKPDHLNGFEVQPECDAEQDRRQQVATSKGGRLQFRTPRPKRDITIGSNTSDRVPDTTVINGLDEDNVYSVFVTYFEAYNNYVYDLLEDIPDNNMTKALQTKILREDGNRNMYVHDCNEVEVKSAEDALELLKRGQKRRKVAHTRLNAESSRSHSIFTIRIVQCPLDERGAQVLTGAGLRISQLSLVDLAGSERTSRTRAAGLRIKEAGSINNTLMMLRTCIEVLRDNQLNNASRMVPYRDSKITHYFKNYFDGEGKVRMIICVNPQANDYDETLPVMKFAELASEVQVQRSVVRNEAAWLPTGRRKANLIFREAGRHIQERLEKAKEQLDVNIRPIYSLGPAWPVISLTDDSWREAIHKLKTVLQKRICNRDNMIAEARQTSVTIIERVAAQETEALVQRQEMASFKALYEDRERKIREYEGKLLNAEAVNESINTKYNDLVDGYNQALEELNLAQNQGQLEKQRLKAKLNIKLEQDREKQERDYKMRLKEHKNKMVSTQVRALREFVTDGNSNRAQSRHQTPRAEPPSTPSLAGDVLPTAGGGSQVVFQDVEILRQRDPLSVPAAAAGATGGGGVKRGSDGTPVDQLLLHERWKSLAATPGPVNKRKKIM